MITLEIQRSAGLDTRRVTAEAGYGLVEGCCPGCDAKPFQIVTHPIELVDGRARAGARCLGCNDPVGYCYTEPDTIFGKEEDDAVFLHGRARVYGGVIRDPKP